LRDRCDVEELAVGIEAEAFCLLLSRPDLLLFLLLPLIKFKVILPLIRLGLRLLLGLEERPFLLFKL